MTVKLARWSLHFYALPYRREIVWANAVEAQGVYALLMIEVMARPFRRMR